MPRKVQIPIITNDVIEYLDSIFPEKCADLKDTEKEVFFKWGQRSVFNHLIQQKSLAFTTVM